MKKQKIEKVSMERLTSNEISPGLKATHKRLTKAMEQSEKLTADMFTQKATIKHEDGSHFVIENCIAYKENEHVIVIPEHGHPLIFGISDLADYKFSKGVMVTCPDCRGNGWTPPYREILCSKCNGALIVKAGG